MSSSWQVYDEMLAYNNYRVGVGIFREDEMLLHRMLMSIRRKSQLKPFKRILTTGNQFEECLDFFLYFCGKGIFR